MTFECDHANQHPQARGVFENAEEEFWAVYGKPSSADYMDKAVEVLRLRAMNLRELANLQEQEAAALERRDLWGAASAEKDAKPLELVQDSQHYFAGIYERRAVSAAQFEARFTGFDVYKAGKPPSAATMRKLQIKRRDAKFQRKQRKRA